MVTTNDTIDAQESKGAQGDFFDSDPSEGSDYLKPKITVFGVGGAGGNAVNNMIRSSLEGVDFIVANTDSQALLQSLCDRRIQLGFEITGGLGAGARPDVGRAAAEEVVDDIVSYVKNSNMVFITAGMGGGTGTGAAPVIARIAKEHGVLTIGVITKPFHFEGTTRMRTAEKGIDELQQYVDTLIVIPNQNLFRVANEKTTFADAFKMADDVLRSGVQGVTDLMVMPGLINLDFADIKTVMSEMGKAMMGTGDADGEKRAIEAAEAAISNPLLDDVSMKGARGILINVTGGYDMTLYEVDEAANRIREEVDPEANIIFGSTFNEKMNGRMRVSVVATGIDAAAVKQKKQAYEEMTALHSMQSEPTERPIPVTEDDAVNSEDKTTPVFGVIKNSSVENSQASQPKRKAPSLFERLTGMRKSFASEKKEEFVVQQQKPQDRTQEEDLEIPAFLRKNT
jgi:cell division protein FtsZ